MASASPSPSGNRRDRLSDLPEFLLGHVLSFLPNKQAGRAALLSRHWRHVFSNGHTVSFAERAGARANDWTTFYYEAKEKKSCSAALLDDVWSALLCRRRCAGTHAPLRRFQVAFDSCIGWDRCHVDQWLSYVLRYSIQELNLDLRFRLGPTCAHRSGQDREWRRRGGWYDPPSYLFSCTAMRSLRLAYCGLNLPATIDLPFVHTLRLTGVGGSGGSIKRLVASCPRLLDLTLEACGGLDKVFVLDRRLRRFALLCCHNLETVDIDASELSSLDYCGTPPPESLLCLRGVPEIIPSCTVDFCKVLPDEEAEHARITRFLEKISGAKRLHLHHECLPAKSFEGFPWFPNMTRLVLQGPLQSPDVVRTILEHTPNLEVLTLLMDFSVVPDEEVVEAAPDDVSYSVPCLRHRVREINMVHYQGDVLQRMMARLLLGNALGLERLCVVLLKGSFELQAGMKREIESWVVADDVEKIFL
ncbi:hypothetical protein ACQ4PT_058229 [Festuca glaucescens]